MLPPVSPRRAASRRQLSTTSAMTRANLVALDAEAVADLRRELLRVLRDERDRADPGQAQRLERAALASGLCHAASMRGAGAGARVSTMRVRAVLQPAPAVWPRVRLRPPRRRSAASASVDAATSSASAASVPPTDATPTSAPRSSRRRANSGSRSLRAATSGAARKIDEYAPEPMPTRSAKAKSFERVASEEVERGDREQRDERRRERPREHLPHRDVPDDAERRTPHERHVLAHAVEDDDRVVDRVAEHREDRRDGRRRHLAPCERVDTDRDHDVVGERDEHAHRVLPLEADRRCRRRSGEGSRRSRRARFSRSGARSSPRRSSRRTRSPRRCS